MLSAPASQPPFALPFVHSPFAAPLVHSLDSRRDAERVHSGLFGAALFLLIGVCLSMLLSSALLALRAGAFTPRECSVLGARVAKVSGDPEGAEAHKPLFKLAWVLLVQSKRNFTFTTYGEQVFSLESAANASLVASGPHPGFCTTCLVNDGGAFAFRELQVLMTADGVPTAGQGAASLHGIRVATRAVTAVAAAVVACGLLGAAVAWRKGGLAAVRRPLLLPWLAAAMAVLGCAVPFIEYYAWQHSVGRHDASAAPPRFLTISQVAASGRWVAHVFSAAMCAAAALMLTVCLGVSPALRRAAAACGAPRSFACWRGCYLCATGLLVLLAAFDSETAWAAHVASSGGFFCTATLSSAAAVVLLRRWRRSAGAPPPAPRWAAVQVLAVGAQVLAGAVYAAGVAGALSWAAVGGAELAFVLLFVLSLLALFHALPLEVTCPPREQGGLGGSAQYE